MSALQCNELSVGDIFTGGLPEPPETWWWLWPSAMLLWLLLMLHAVLFLATLRLDASRLGGEWSDEYFMTRDAGHQRRKAGCCGSVQRLLQTLTKDLGLFAWVQSVRLSSANYLIRQMAATKIQTTEVDVRFMLEHMHQVAFATEESTWTRRRNRDFLALQLRVHSALLEAHADLFKGGRLLRRTWRLFWVVQPHLDLRYWSICLPAHMRALLLSSKAFGRMAVVALWLAATGVSMQITSPSDCTSRDYMEWFFQDMARGTFVEVIFSCVSFLLHLTWVLVLAVLHSREFEYDETWDAAKRRRQLRIWCLQDIAFGILVLADVIICTLLTLAFLLGTRKEDGLRWLVSCITALFWMSVLEPLVFSTWCVAAALAATQYPELAERSRKQLGFEAHGQHAFAMQSMAEELGIPEGARPDEAGSPIRNPSPGPRAAAGSAESAQTATPPPPPPVPVSGSKAQNHFVASSPPKGRQPPGHTAPVMYVGGTPTAGSPPTKRAGGGGTPAASPPRGAVLPGPPLPNTPL